MKNSDLQRHYYQGSSEVIEHILVKAIKTENTEYRRSNFSLLLIQ